MSKHPLFHINGSIWANGTTRNIKLFPVTNFLAKSYKQCLLKIGHTLPISDIWRQNVYDEVKLYLHLRSFSRFLENFRKSRCIRCFSYCFSPWLFQRQPIDNLMTVSFHTWFLFVKTIWISIFNPCKTMEGCFSPQKLQLLHLEQVDKKWG